MKLRRWFALRGPDFVRRRAGALLERYGLTPERAEARIQANVALLAEYACAPTFPTPGRVVQWHAPFIRRLQQAGAEIAVHSYDHLDLKGYPPAQASSQLVKGAQVFERYGIENYGFRCPYLSCTDELLDALPSGMFGYSSNEAIAWDFTPPGATKAQGPIMETLNRFYNPRPATDAVCMPRWRAGLVEIPVCVPDDLQLHDGLKAGPEGISWAWNQMLYATYQRGEAFTLLFHPELAERCAGPFRELLRETGRLTPYVWLARLCDIGTWWHEKAKFSVTVAENGAGMRICFECSDRATVLQKGLAANGSEQPWESAKDGANGPAYREVRGRTVDVPPGIRPLLGISSSTSQAMVSFLSDQGYILDKGETAAQCAIYLDEATLGGLRTEREIINHIESAPGPLVRYWPWPSGARSALAVTGDLDALTLVDYTPRLWAH